MEPIVVPLEGLPHETDGAISAAQIGCNFYLDLLQLKPSERYPLHDPILNLYISRFQKSSYGDVAVIVHEALRQVLYFPVLSVIELQPNSSLVRVSEVPRDSLSLAGQQRRLDAALLHAAARLRCPESSWIVSFRCFTGHLPVMYGKNSRISTLETTRGPSK